MTKKYQITAEVKKADQEWASVVLNRDSPMTEESLAKMYGAPKIPVQVRNIESVRVK